MSEQLAYTPEQAAAKVGLSKDTIMRQIRAGKLRAKKVGRLYSIPEKNLREWHQGLEDA